MPTLREQFVQEVRSYVGTPFAWRGRTPGLNGQLDCIGVPVCGARKIGVVAPDFDVEPYTQQPDGYTFLAECDKYMIRVEKEYLQVGDLIVFKIEALPQHIGVLGNYKYGGFSLIHAAMRVDPPRVIETRLMFSKIMVYVQGYKLPGID